jgi:acetyltransferase-like isoleucine patch superfamily enzyme
MNSYDGYGPELIQARFRIRKLMNKYNTHFPDDATPESLGSDRRELLQQMIGKIGKGSYIEPPVQLDYGCNISIGEGFYSNFKCVVPALPLTPFLSLTHERNSLLILDCSIVTIGNRVLFGPWVSIFSATHDTEVQSRRNFVEYAKPVTIGDDCWIGGNTTIMPGVAIGKGCTVGAGSVVTKDIPDFSVAIGAPARVVKTVEAVPDLS